MVSKNRGLGKGIDALFVTSMDDDLIGEDKARIKFIPVKEISPNEQQPRTSFNEEALEELAASIVRHGILQPLIVIKNAGGFQIVAGERRWRAAKKAGLSEVPVIIRSLEELEKLEIALIENVQRVDLSPLDQALSIYKLHQQFSIEYNEIATRLGKSPATVSNIVRLLQLPEPAAKALAANEISEGHSRAILALAGNPGLQAQLLKNIVDEGWTVRQAESFVKSTKQGPLKSIEKKVTSAVQTTKDEKLSRELKLPVIIKKQNRGGQMIIRFASDSELEKLKQRLLS